MLSLKEVKRLISRTRKLSYQVYFLTTYSLGLRLSESLNLTIADVDSHLSGCMCAVARARRIASCLYR